MVLLVLLIQQGRSCLRTARPLAPRPRPRPQGEARGQAKEERTGSPVPTSGGQSSDMATRLHAPVDASTASGRQRHSFVAWIEKGSWAGLIRFALNYRVFRGQTGCSTAGSRPCRRRSGKPWERRSAVAPRFAEYSIMRRLRPRGQTEMGRPRTNAQSDSAGDATGTTRDLIADQSRNRAFQFDWSGRKCEKPRGLESEEARRRHAEKARS